MDIILHLPYIISILYFNDFFYKYIFFLIYESNIKYKNKIIILLYCFYYNYNKLIIVLCLINNYYEKIIFFCIIFNYIYNIIIESEYYLLKIFYIYCLLGLNLKSKIVYNIHLKYYFQLQLYNQLSFEDYFKHVILLKNILICLF
jgi:hypothetical protein